MRKKDLPKIKKIKNTLESLAESERKKSKNFNMPVELNNKIRKCASLFECATEDLNIIISIVENK